MSFDYGKYFGEMQLDAGAADDEFKTRIQLQPVNKGPAIVHTGTGLVYAGYSWRGRSKGAGMTTSNTADDLAQEAMDQFVKFVSLLQSGEKGFSSRLIPAQQFEYGGDYDHLARVSEWSTAESEQEGGGDE